MRQRLEEMSSATTQQLIQRLMDKLEEGGYINMDGPPADPPRAPGAEGGPENQMQFRGDRQGCRFSADSRR